MTRFIGAHFTPEAGNLITAPASTAKHYGASCFQMFVGPNKGYKPFFIGADTVETFKQLKGGRKVSAHGPYLPNVCCDERWQDSVDSIVGYMQAADQLGIEFMVFHPGSHKGLGEDIGRAWFLKASREIVERTKGGKIKLLWENTAGGGTQVGHVDNVARLVREVGHDRIGMCLDTTHSFADGHNLADHVYRQEFWAKYKDVTDWVHFNNPDRKVELGSHLDRHRQNWLDAKWPVDVMISIADEWGDSVPLCMEADPTAYEVNFMLLDESGFM